MFGDLPVKIYVHITKKITAFLQGLSKSIMDDSKVLI